MQLAMTVDLAEVKSETALAHPGAGDSGKPVLTYDGSVTNAIHHVSDHVMLLPSRFSKRDSQVVPAPYSFVPGLLCSASSHPLGSCKQLQHARGAMPLNSLRSRVKDRLHHRNKAAWAQGQDNEVDDDASIMSDDSLTMTAVSGARSQRVLVQAAARLSY